MTISKIVATPNSAIFDDIYVIEDGKEKLYGSIKREVRHSISTFDMKIFAELTTEIINGIISKRKEANLSKNS